ncbi:hypothetical protein [Arthrobacter bambusae]|uniref:hypothetical protein n=1 Tax=Arthrobacter bambusae TaxID=1338426 RepID=UPI0027817D66|nr:hypothetical protein [Arthrobacter bambusae]MDQ0029473.1 hypothetical protein [Arthrobacter bambusae]MDQ0097133.1 hypothetical protein [Arthrobacter bambusae]
MPKQYSPRYQLKGASLEAIRVKAEQQYGPGARIVSAEKVTNPGIAGLFAANRYEATIEVPAGGTSLIPGGPAHALQGPAIAALLEQADAAEMDLHRPSEGVSAAVVSTASPDFAGMLEQLGKEFEAPGSAVGHAVPVPVPVPLAGSGNLIIVVGLGDAALGPALDMSIAEGGSDVRTAGALTAFGHLHVAGRQGATAARAQAVLTGQTVLVAYGLGRPGEAATHAAAIAALAPDQLWLAADAGRKAEDTAAWVRALTTALAAERVLVDALAVFGASETGSPETVNGLGLPIGWVDGKPARVAVLGKVD